MRKLLLAAVAVTGLASPAQAQGMTSTEAVELVHDFLQCAMVAGIAAKHAPEGSALHEQLEGASDGGFVASELVLRTYGPENWKLVLQNVFESSSGYVLTLYEGGGLDEVMAFGAKCGAVSKKQGAVLNEWRGNGYALEGE